MSTIDIRSCCEKFGALEVYRPDFSDRGIIFVGYYDIRSAQKAALDLRKNISLLTSSSTQVEIKYCVPLNSSSADDESVIILSDLPHYVDEREVLSILSSYGSVRSVNLLPGTHYGGRSYVIEFHNIQDAKLARLELETSQPWGPDTMIEVGVRRAVDRKRGRELLSIIGRWRQGSRQTGHQPPPSMTGTPHRSASASVSVRDDSTSSRSVNSSSALLESYHSHHYELHSSKTTTVPQQTTQLVLGPDGRYSYMVVSGNAFAPRAMPPLPQLNPHGGMEGFPVHLAQHQSMYHDPYGGGFVASVSPAQPHPSQIDWEQGTPVQQQHYQRPLVMSRPGTTNIPYASDGVVYLPHASAPSYFAQVVRTPADSTVSSGSNPRMHDATRRPQNDDKDHRHLLMDIAAVDAGKDTRTSLMVRNIPNKYTQQMLLSEFAESGHGPGTIDFFYLPIDFKNKCNRGYAFVNFVDYRDIVAFHRQYSGQHWRVFNSDKICEITYARIQGKAGMLKRFENSALMEKDEEYKPLVFVSQGPDKGKPLNFPTTIE
jgi:RNA recognition motif-containing protein